MIRWVASLAGPPKQRTWLLVLDQAQGQGRACGDGAPGIFEQGRRYGTGIDDRVSPFVEADHLRQEFGAGAVALAGDRVDPQVLVHDDITSSPRRCQGRRRERA